MNKSSLRANPYHHGRYARLAMVVVVLTSSPVLAQKSAPCERLDTVRGQPLTAGDDQLLDACVSAELDRLNQAFDQAVSPGTAVAEFRSRIVAEYSNKDNTDAFKARFVERTASLFAGRIVADKTNPLSAQAMAGVLADFESPQTRSALLAALKSDDATVRYLSVKALRELKGDIAGDANDARSTITALAQAGAVEKSGVATGMIYDALNYDQFKSESVDALIQTFTGRVELVKQPGRRLDRGELPALAAFDGLASDLGNRANDLVRPLATLLRVHVEHYKPQDLEMYERAAIEETIVEAESLLKKLVRGSNLPNIGEKMQRGGDAATIDMQIELNRWIGVGATDGVLNAAPYSVPRGAP